MSPFPVFIQRPDQVIRNHINRFNLPDSGMYENFSLIRRLSQLGTWMQTALSGAFVGADQFGNRYYEEKAAKTGEKKRRWVLYTGEPDTTKIPPDWHNWMHYTWDRPMAHDDPLHPAWQKQHHPNLSGTPDAYYPTNHPLSTDYRPDRQRAYQAWGPDRT